MTQSKHYIGLDQLRGIAIILMVIFHLAFDLNHFAFIEINIYGNLFWFGFPRFITALFLLICGISLHLAYKKEISYKKFGIKLLKLTIIASAISLITYLNSPDRWIYFGIIHCIALSTILALPLVRHPRIALLCGLTVLSIRFPLQFKPNFLFSSSGHSLDFIPIYPWLSVVLIGIFLGSIGTYKIQMPKALPASSRQLLAFLGNHSLLIYVIHQPILFGMLFLLKQFWSATK